MPTNALPILVVAVAALLLGGKKKKAVVVDDPIPDPDPVIDDLDPDPKPEPIIIPPGPTPSPEPIIKDEESLDYSGPLNGGTGAPPNLSGNPKGYNTGLFSSGMAVRMMFNQMGYIMVTIINDQPPATQVRNFQRDYNLISSWAYGVKGRLAEDGVSGKNTLNGLEAALKLSKIGWTTLRGQAQVLEATHKNA